MRKEPEGQSQTYNEWKTEFLQHLQVDFVNRTAQNFLENVDQVDALIRMPGVLFGFLEIENQYKNLFADLARNTRGGDYTSFLVDMLQKWNEKTKEIRSGRFWDLTADRIKTTLDKPPYGSGLKKSMEVLRSSAVSASWTAFECLAGDLWVSALNENPRPLAQMAITTLSRDDDEVSPKQISMGLAAKYGFDLRHCLGSVLKSRFDFTGVTGIRKAYKVFGEDSYLNETLESSTLLELEITRHLIVHRGGVVDEEYRKRSKMNAELGQPLTLSEERVEELHGAMRAAGIKLLAFVNDKSAEDSSQSREIIPTV